MKKLIVFAIFMIIATSAFAAGFVAYNEDVYTFYFAEDEFDIVNELGEEWNYMRKFDSSVDEIEASSIMISTTLEWTKGLWTGFMDIRQMTYEGQLFMVMSQDQSVDRVGNIMELIMGY